MLHTLLVANRGEVASRIFRSARARGLRTVAVTSEADACLPFVTHADRSVCIGPGPASESYLDPARLLDAAARTGANGIHPGWGFLAERADFAAAVIEAGLIWVGPSPASIEALGDKSRARALAESLGMAVVPGYHGDDPDELRAMAHQLGFPVLIKASAGGGGRGMRKVDRAEDLDAALTSAAREAQSAFGSARLLLERWVERPRHIEVQVFGDGRGGAVHLFERECSIQRRHQKVVEEAPAPNLSPGLRATLFQEALTLTRAVQYAGAGTVEFIVGADGSHAFLEMNTRLQVEHEVTECITGVDLVDWQLAIADGEPLPLDQEALVARGHAIEVRVIAEDPNRDYLATHGRIARLDLQGDRVSASFRDGDEVGVHYDNLLAKVICTGPDRKTACRKLSRALEQAWIPGLTTNLPLLRQIAERPAWWAGELHTGFLTEQGLPTPPPPNPELSALGAAVAVALYARQRAPTGLPAGFRVGGPAFATDTLSVAGETLELCTRWRADQLDVVLPTGEHTLVLHEPTTDGAVLTVKGVRQHWRILAPGVPDGGPIYVHDGQAEGLAVLASRFPPPAAPVVDPGSCLAPTPGTVRALNVKPGDTVEAGAVLVVLEAMKMEHAVRAPASGTVREVRWAVGDSVKEGALLVVLEPTSSA